MNDFRAKAIRELIKIKIAWPGLDYATPRGALELLPSTVPSVPALTKADRTPTSRPVPIRRSPGFKFLHNRRGAYYVFLMTTCS